MYWNWINPFSNPILKSKGIIKNLYVMSLFELQMEIQRKEDELSILKNNLKQVAREILFPKCYMK